MSSEISPLLMNNNNEPASESSYRDIEVAVGSSEIYEQHDDPDVIIPDKIAFPLVVSSHLLLVTAIVALVYARYGIFAVVFAVYLTSIWHWHKPRFSSIARRVDYLAVFTAIAYGSYVATTLGYTYILVWFIGLGLIAVIFINNETLYYYQVMKSVDGSLSAKSQEGRNTAETTCYGQPVTKANTAERDFVYKRTVWVHLICVHVFANALALSLVIANS